MGYAPREQDRDEANDPKNKLESKAMVFDRKCTDILCCMVFLAFIIFTAVICGYGLSKGDPSRIMTPFDSDGNACG